MSIDISMIHVLTAGDTVTIYHSAQCSVGASPGEYFTGVLAEDGQTIWDAGDHVNLGLPCVRIVSHTPVLAEPKRPDWANAQVVRVSVGAKVFWTQDEIDDAYYREGLTLADFERGRGPVTVVIDSEGRNVEAYRENDRGGEARGVVAGAALALGFDLSDDQMIGERWSEENMGRIVTAIRELKARADIAEALAEDYNREADRISQHAQEQRNALVERVKRAEERAERAEGWWQYYKADRDLLAENARELRRQCDDARAEKHDADCDKAAAEALSTLARRLDRFAEGWAKHAAGDRNFQAGAHFAYDNSACAAREAIQELAGRVHA